MFKKLVSEIVIKNKRFKFYTKGFFKKEFEVFIYRINSTVEGFDEEIGYLNSSDMEDIKAFTLTFKEV